MQIFELILDWIRCLEVGLRGRKGLSNLISSNGFQILAISFYDIQMASKRPIFQKKLLDQLAPGDSAIPPFVKHRQTSAFHLSISPPLTNSWLRVLSCFTIAFFFC